MSPELLLLLVFGIVMIRNNVGKEDGRSFYIVLLIGYNSSGESDALLSFLKRILFESVTVVLLVIEMDW